MDAKKKAKFIKPKYFNDTKAHSLFLKTAAGFAIYVFVASYLALAYDRSKPDRFITNNVLTRYWNSEENRIRMAKYAGIYPPDKPYEEPVKIFSGEE